MEPGHLLADRYELVSHIARGGMADVWQAQDRALNRRVAVKVLHSQFSNDESFVRRFRREAQAAANLAHPNIVSIFDWGQEGATYFIVMELVEGRSLRDVLRSEGPLLPRRATEIAAEAAAALSVAHGAGLVHRDVKPGNILLTRDGTVKVTDFGIARAWDDSLELTRTGAVIGTATYFSPEQAQGESADARSDLYALGIVLFEMLTGTVPFKGESPVAVAYQHVSATVAPPRSIDPHIPEDLERIVLKAVEKNPVNRYQSADAMRADLMASHSGEPVAAVPAAVVAAPRAAPAAPDEATRIMDGTVMVPPGVPPGGDVPEDRSSQLPFILTAFALLGILVLGIWLMFSFLGSGNGDPVPALVDIPSVEGLTEEQATSLLREAGLVPQVERRADPEVEAGFAIETNPPAGEQLAEGETILLFVSLGLETVQVPSLVGLTLEQANAALRAVGLELGELSPVPSTDFDEGTVVNSNPISGQEVEVGSSVDLFVSSGPGDFDMPNYRGQVFENVRFELTQAGMTVVERSEPDEEVAEGFVIRTDPGPGLVAVGTTVTVWVSDGPAPRTVPNLIGMSEAEARTALGNLDLRLRVSDSRVESEQYDGLVAEQVPAAGNTLRPGEEVTVFIGEAPVTTVEVPNLIGLTELEAQAILGPTGLSLAVDEEPVITDDPDNDLRIAQQTPLPGVNVQTGTTVIVRV